MRHAGIVWAGVVALALAVASVLGGCTRPGLSAPGSAGAQPMRETGNAEPLVLDNFETLEGWRVSASDGVQARISTAEGIHGRALRLDFDFERGAGFCVIHRDLPLRLPQNYRFTLALRGAAPPNNLEFKLLDPSGDNVWWVNRRAFEFPTDWRTLSYKARQFRFAWGPSGGKPLDAVGALELAVAASSGGKGYLLFDRLTFEALPDLPAILPPPSVGFSSTAEPGAPQQVTPSESGVVNWTSAAHDAQPWLQIDWRAERELGGVAIEWGAADYATAYTVSRSEDGRAWSPASTVAGGTGGRDYVLLRDADTRYLRVDVRGTSRRRGVQVRAVRALGPDVAESPNSLYAQIARDAPRGWFPRYFLGEQQPWTVVGVPVDDKEALLDAAGVLEVDKLGFRIEPFLLVDGRLITWADVTTRQSLAKDHLPIPSVTWQGGDLELEITALADGPAAESAVSARYVVRNTGAAPRRAALVLALRPFQVLPPWQEVNITGGVSRIETIQWDRRCVLVNGQKTVRPWTTPAAFGAAPFMQGDICKYLASGQLPTSESVNDPTGLASAALRYDFDLAAGASQAAIVTVPFHGKGTASPLDDSAEAPATRFEQRLQQACRAWEEEVSRVRLLLPPQAAKLADTFQATQAYMLINADGPAIQPGSRTYERSWIRDGALTSTALLYTGHPERVRAFLDWYGQYQYPSGKVPCVVDRRGADPVPEHDSTGELIYALLKYYQFTRDRGFLEEHLPQVIKGVDYIEELRNQRLTDTYRAGSPEQRACYGLVPESISHEGYSAKPMHSYWDDFWVLRGLKDATTIAQLLGKPELEARFRTLRDEFRTTLYASLRLAMQTKQIDYIPGCVELGDFDATSTATAVYPCGEADALPEAARTHTFDRYYDFFRQRRDGQLAWDNYTPYEIRLVSTFVYLGQPQRAHELLDFFLADQRPQAWNQWAEVVWRDPLTPKYIGDMPHTWVGAEFVCALRSLFVYERERDAALVLAAGVRPEWLDAPGGVSIANWPTEYGRLSYDLSSRDKETVLTLHFDGELPPGGLVFRNPYPEPIRSVAVDGHRIETFTEREVVLKVAAVQVVITRGP
jgi:hypothetical protein